MAVMSVVSSLAAFLLACYLWRKHRDGGKVKWPPGPSQLFSLPLIGHMLLLVKKNPVQKLLEYNKKYGGIFRLDVGHLPTVFICDWQLIVKAANSRACSGRSFPSWSGAEHFRKKDSKGNLQGIIASHGEVWHEQRLFMMQNLNSLGMANTDTTDNIIAQEAEQMVERLRRSCIGKNPVCINHGYFLTMVLNVIWRIVTGKKRSQEDPELVKLTKTISEVFHFFDVGNPLKVMQFVSPLFLALCNFLGVPTINEALKPLYDVMEQEVDEAEEKGNEDTFAGRYMAEMERQKNNPKSSFYGRDGQVHMIGQLFDIFQAGSDTVDIFLEWAMLYMVAYPEVQERVHKEIKDCFDLDGQITSKDEFRLPFCMATINEIGRHCPASAFGVPHETLEDFSLGGYMLPKGTQLFFFASGVHMDERFYTNPEIFNPTRFIDGTDGSYATNEHFLGFGHGQRRCVGEKLGRAESFLFFAAIMQKFKLSKGTKEQMLDFSPLPGIGLRPPAFEMLIEERM